VWFVVPEGQLGLGLGLGCVVVLYLKVGFRIVSGDFQVISFLSVLLFIRLGYIQIHITHACVMCVAGWPMTSAVSSCASS